MGDQRQAPEADRILVAQLTGEARRHAQWRPLTAEEEAAALAELRALAAGRADLLAEVAGILEGTSEGELDEPLARSAARLCREAGAAPEAIPAWIEEGRRRSANARRPPFSGGLGSGGGRPGLTAAGRCRFSPPACFTSRATSPQEDETMLPYRLPYSGAHWVDHVARHAYSTPDAAAIRYQGESITWARLHDRVRRAAAAFAGQGVSRGDRVAILMTNRPEFVESVLAANAIGAIAVPVNFRLAPAEAAYILQDSGAALIVTDTLLASLATAAAAALPAPPRVVTTGDAGNYETLLDEARASTEAVAGVEASAAEIDERDVALIMYTSGTTGRPKGAMLTHLNLLMQAITAIRASRLNDDGNVVLINVPLFHIAGIGGMVPPLMLGTTAVVMPTAPFDAETTLHIIETEGVTSLFLVPAQWQALCAHPDVTRRTRSLRSISWGAAPATVTLLETMAKTFPDAEIISVFGQTEMAPVTTVLPGAYAISKIGSVGKPIPTIAARVVDERMNDVAPGEVGEIVYRGPSLMAGYWNNPAATEEAFGGGWFHSGDLVRADEDGFLYVVDRKKDMIISGGENIYCAEVENVLSGHPAVADVAVIGARHEKWGETPIAIVVPADQAAPPTLDDLTGWTAGRLASYKKPTGLVILAELPRNASGKVLKHELRTRYGQP